MPNKVYDIPSKKKLNPLRLFNANAQIRFNFRKHPHGIIQAHRVEIPSLSIGRESLHVRQSGMQYLQ